MNLTLPEMVQKYILIRDTKDAIAKELKEKTERMSQAMEKLEGLMHKKLKDEGMDSFKSKEFGTVFLKKRSSCSVKDRDDFYKWAVDNDQLGAIDMKANAKAVRELLAEGIEVPGVNYSETEMVGVRRPSK